MPEAPSIFPELGWSCDALIAIALRANLFNDPLLNQAIVQRGGSIEAIERRAVLELADITAPFLGITIRADEEGPSQSSFGMEVLTLVDLVLLTSPPLTAFDTQEFLRSRMVRQIKVVIRQDKGALLDDTGRCIARAQTEIARINFDEGELPSGLVPTVLRVTYHSDVDQHTQEIFE